MDRHRIRLAAVTPALAVALAAYPATIASGCSSDGTLAATDAGDASLSDGSPSTEAGDASPLLDATTDAPVDAGPVESGLPAATACDAAPCDWTQWAHDARHTGATLAVGQAPRNLLARLVFDPFTTLEQAASGGDLLAHYQTPLLAGDDVYMLTKRGAYVACPSPDGGPCGPAVWGTQIWAEKHLQWQGGALVDLWTFESDWKPEPAELALGWEPVFQPALSGAFLYVPGAGGAVWKLDRSTGAVVSHIQPFGSTIDPGTFVAGPLTVDAAGDILYDALALDLADPIGHDATGTLVKISPGDVVKTATYASLVPDAPKPTDACPSAFNGGEPLPPAPDEAGAPVLPPRVPCLSQRPGINVAPAVADDGTIVTVSVAHGSPYASYLVAVNPDLTPRWDASLAGRVDDGCGVLEPSMAFPEPDGSVGGFGCRIGATHGVDPFTNEPPVPRVIDLSSSTPVVLPDGSILYGALTDYNTARGHLMHFSASGQWLGAYDFGWDVTPAVVAHGSSYSVMVKDNHYWNWGNGLPPGPYGMTRLDPSLTPEWSFENHNSLSCTRQPSGVVTCVSDHPYGFEWCVNAPAIDRNGMTYANSEDGNLYVLAPDGGMASQTFLELALGAAYTPIALDHEGRMYALNGGTLRVLGQ